jgi:hypothetical protein
MTQMLRNADLRGFLTLPVYIKTQKVFLFICVNLRCRRHLRHLRSMMRSNIYPQFYDENEILPAVWQTT